VRNVQAAVSAAMAIAETASGGLYHPGECHSQAFVMFILERAEQESGEPDAN
jgi:hypothetical protein